MSLTAAIWFATFLALSFLTFKKSVWGFGLYLLTFYASPLTWWWGEGFLQSMGSRWNLIASLFFLLASLLDSRPKIKGPSITWFFLALFAYSANAAIVHFAFADNPPHSYELFDAIWKNCLLASLLVITIRDWNDFRLVFLLLVLGSSYLGYEVVINDEGHYDDGRLEQISISGVNGANSIASLLSFTIPLGVCLFFFNRMRNRLMILLPMIFTIEVIARCVSRGNMVGWLASMIVFMVVAKGSIRKKAIQGLIGCCLIAVFFMGEQHRETFVTRFSSIFAEKEERDVSAKSRVSFTEKGLEMIFDYPMGSGGEAAFRSNRGMTYIASVGETRFRSCHNGYIDIAASWGAQGLFLYLGTLLVIMWKVARASRRVYESNEEASFVGACFCAMISLQLVTCYFGSFLDGEWYYWWMALGVAYLRLTDPDVNLMPAEHPHEHEFNGTQTKTSFVS